MDHIGPLRPGDQGNTYRIHSYRPRDSIPQLSKDRTIFRDEQGRKAIKEEIKDEELMIPVTEVAMKSTSSDNDRKVGRSFLDDLRSDLRVIVIDGDDNDNEPASKKKKLVNETKKLELQESELKLREDKLYESRQARKEHID